MNFTITFIFTLIQCTSVIRTALGMRELALIDGWFLNTFEYMTNQYKIDERKYQKHNKTKDQMLEF